MNFNALNINNQLTYITVRISNNQRHTVASFITYLLVTSTIDILLLFSFLSYCTCSVSCLGLSFSWGSSPVLVSMDDDRGSKPANDMLCQIFELKAILKIHARSKFKKHFFLYYYLHTRVLVRMKKFAER